MDCASKSPCLDGSPGSDPIRTYPSRMVATGSLRLQGIPGKADILAWHDSTIIPL